MKARLWQLMCAGLLFSAITSLATVRYVNLNNPGPESPYTSWSTAATNIQNAIDVAVDSDHILVSNGTYNTGGRVISAGVLTNRVAVTKPIIVQSVNGPEVTKIQGNISVITDTNGGIRCVYLTNGAVLSGFTLFDGNNVTLPPLFTAFPPNINGGAVWCESGNVTVSNCVLTGNTAFRNGGGAYRGRLFNCTIANNTTSSNGAGAAYCSLSHCTITNNRAAALGGGVADSVLNNCLVASNTAHYGGGAAYCTLSNCTVANNLTTLNGGGTYLGTNDNCIIHYNIRSVFPGYSTNNYSGGEFNYCCTLPLPSGPGNLTNAPLFVNWTGGNFHLQSNSPCINSGGNAYATVAMDLDGNPRIQGGTVDMGAYEYQTPGSVISYAWLQQYGLTNNGTADYTDLDEDGFNNYNEWRAGTMPNNPSSRLKMTTLTNGVSGIIVSWQSVSGVSYFLQRGTSLATQPVFSTIQSNIVGQAGTTSYTDTSAVGSELFLYRAGVQ
jgi:parallel beta-helix repeat protein